MKTTTDRDGPGRLCYHLKTGSPYPTLSIQFPPFMDDVELTPTLFLQITSPIFWLWTKFSSQDIEDDAEATNATHLKPPPNKPTKLVTSSNIIESTTVGNPLLKNTPFFKSWFRNSTSKTVGTTFGHRGKRNVLDEVVNAFDSISDRMYDGWVFVKSSVFRFDDDDFTIASPIPRRKFIRTTAKPNSLTEDATEVTGEIAVWHCKKVAKLVFNENKDLMFNSLIGKTESAEVVLPQMTLGKKDEIWNFRRSKAYQNIDEGFFLGLFKPVKSMETSSRKSTDSGKITTQAVFDVDLMKDSSTFTDDTTISKKTGEMVKLTSQPETMTNYRSSTTDLNLRNDSSTSSKLPITKAPSVFKKFNYSQFPLNVSYPKVKKHDFQRNVTKKSAKFQKIDFDFVKYTNFPKIPPGKFQRSNVDLSKNLTKAQFSDFNHSITFSVTPKKLEWTSLPTWKSQTITYELSWEQNNKTKMFLKNPTNLKRPKFEKRETNMTLVSTQISKHRNETRLPKLIFSNDNKDNISGLMTEKLQRSKVDPPKNFTKTKFSNFNHSTTFAVTPKKSEWTSFTTWKSQIKNHEFSLPKNNNTKRFGKNQTNMRRIKFEKRETNLTLVATQFSKHRNETRFPRPNISNDTKDIISNLMTEKFQRSKVNLTKNSTQTKFSNFNHSTTFAVTPEKSEWTSFTTWKPQTIRDEVLSVQNNNTKKFVKKSRRIKFEKRGTTLTLVQIEISKNRNETRFSKEKFPLNDTKDGISRTYPNRISQDILGSSRVPRIKNFSSAPSLKNLNETLNESRKSDSVNNTRKFVRITSSLAKSKLRKRWTNLSSVYPNFQKNLTTVFLKTSDFSLSKFSQNSKILNDTEIPISFNDIKVQTEIPVTNHTSVS